MLHFALRALSCGGVVIIRNIHRFPDNKRLWQQCKEQMKSGQTFTNEKIAIMVGNPGLPLEHFLLWF